MLRILLPLEPLLQLAGGQLDGMSMASSRVLESITAVNAQLACALKERGALICDVRCRPKWRAIRIPGALHVHLDSLHEVDLARVARKDTPMVFYGDGYGSVDAALAVRRAHDWGYRGACWLSSGLPGWIAAGYPAEKPRVRPEPPVCTNTRPDGVLADTAHFDEARFDGARFDAG